MSSPYTPPNAPPPEAPGGKASIGMDANLASMLCYLTMICCGLGIIVSLVIFIIEKTSRLLRFHAMQALLFGALWVVLGIVFRILGTLTYVGLGGEAAGSLGALAIFGAEVLIALILLVFLVIAAIKAYQGQYYKLPIIGNIAWNIVNK